MELVENHADYQLGDSVSIDDGNVQTERCCTSDTAVDAPAASSSGRHCCPRSPATSSST